MEYIRDKKGRFRPIDPEIKAIGVCLKAIASLDKKAQKRIIQYLYSKVSKNQEQLFSWIESAGGQP